MLSKIRNKKSLIFLDQAMVSGSNFVLGILLARYLGVEGYGQFALLWLIVLFFSSLQLAYIISPMLTLASKKKAFLLNQYLSIMAYLQFFFTILLMFCLYLFLEIAVLFNDKWNLGDLKIFIIIVTSFFLFHEYIRRYFIIKVQYYKLLLIDAISYIGQLIFIIYFIYKDTLDIRMVFFAIGVSFILSVLVGLTQLKRASSRKEYKKLIFIKNINFSKWLVFTSILQWGSGNFFVIAAGALLGDWAVGVVRVMQNTMGVLNIFFLSFENLFPISFAKIYNSGKSKNLTAYIRKLFLFGTIIFLLLFFLLYLFSSDLINLLYGVSYTKYSYLLYYYIFIYFGIYISLLLRITIRTLELTKQLFKINVYILLLNIIIVFPMIKFFEINGVVIGILISHILYIVYLNYQLKRSGIILYER